MALCKHVSVRESANSFVCYIGPLYASDRCGSIKLRARRSGRFLSRLLLAALALLLAPPAAPTLAVLCERQ